MRTGLARRRCAWASAGTIESRNGSATAVPRPRRNVRRGSARRVMNISVTPRVASSPRRDLERQAVNDLAHHRLKTITVGRNGALNRSPPPGGRTASGRAPARRSASSSVRVRENCGNCETRSARISPGVLNRWPSGSVPLASTGNFPSGIPPPADGIVVLETEAQRVHVAVTGRTRRIAAMAFQLLAHRAPAARVRILERRNVARRRLGRRAEDVLQHVLAANHGRRSRRIARDRQHGPPG